MKTSDEMVSSLLERRDKYEAEKKRKKKKALISFAAIGCALLSAVSAFGVMHFAKGGTRDDPPAASSCTAASESSAAVPDTTVKMTDTTAKASETGVTAVTTERAAETVWGDSLKAGSPGVSNSTFIQSGSASTDVNVKNGKAINQAVTFKKNRTLEGDKENRFPLYEKYSEADGSTLFALNVLFYTTDEENGKSAEIERELYSVYGYAENQGGLYNEVSVQLEAAKEKIYNAMNVTDAEAGIRAKYEPEYKEAVKKLHDNHLAWDKARLEKRAEMRKDELEYLYSKCDSVMIDHGSESEGAISYLTRTSSLAVVLISKDGIKALEDGGYRYRFSLADIQYERYRMSSVYYAPEGEYCEDKISAAAREALENSNGEAVGLKIYLGLPKKEKDEFDEKYDDEYLANWNRALAKFGLTYEEYRGKEGEKLTLEQHQEILKYKNDLLSRKPEYKELINRLFKDGEVAEDAECLYGQIDVTLTYDRAKELEKEWNVASIKLDRKKEKAYGYDHGEAFYLQQTYTIS